MTFDDLLRAFLDICPDGEMGEDQGGQLIFYTNLRLNDDERTESLDE